MIVSEAAHVALRARDRSASRQVWQRKSETRAVGTPRARSARSSWFTVVGYRVRWTWLCEATATTRLAVQGEVGVCRHSLPRLVDLVFWNESLRWRHSRSELQDRSWRMRAPLEHGIAYMTRRQPQSRSGLGIIVLCESQVAKYQADEAVVCHQGGMHEW
eukprot:scaffold284914_cov32-Tisochrysis_lutea.AAC.3